MNTNSAFSKPKKVWFLHLLFFCSIQYPALSSAQTTELEPLFGEWGTEKQCARVRITSKGTVFAAPFEIQKNWLSHGDVWCRLTWTGTQTSPNGMVAFVQAFCGEDSVRDYQMRVKLDGDELRLFWNIFYRNGPLKRCE